MPGLLGKKIGMTSVFSAEGKNLPCTVIEVGPCVVTQIKTLEKDGYEAVQLGFEEKKEKHTTQPEMGHFKKRRAAAPVPPAPSMQWPRREPRPHGSGRTAAWNRDPCGS